MQNQVRPFFNPKSSNLFNQPITMKRALITIGVLFLTGHLVAQTITEEERMRSLSLLISSSKKLRELTANLSDEQLKFKPAENRWSIQDNTDHLVSSEKLVWNLIAQSLEIQSADQNSDFTDDEFVQMLSTRGDRKFNAPEKLRPSGNEAIPFKELIKDFDVGRMRTIEFIGTTNQDLRSHFQRSPIGALDTYQWTLQIGAHTLRHIEQIEEIKANKNFPSH